MVAVIAVNEMTNAVTAATALIKAPVLHVAFCPEPMALAYKNWSPTPRKETPVNPAVIVFKSRDVSRSLASTAELKTLEFMNPTRKATHT